MKEDLFNQIASATKDTGMFFNGLKIYTNPYIQEGMVYFLPDGIHTDKVENLESVGQLLKKE